MKKTLLIVLVLVLFVSSCKTHKEGCDAYGSVQGEKVDRV